MSIRPSVMALQFDASSFSVVQETRFTWKKAVMSGGIASWSVSMRTVRPRHSTASIRFIFSIQVVPLANKRHPPYYGRLFGRRLLDHEIRLRHSRRRYLLVHG